jgi:heat shock protein HtpX
MWELIRANQRKSAILIIIMGIVLVGLGFLIGAAFYNESGGIWGVLIAIGLWSLLMLISFTSGKDIMLSTSGAKPITPDVHPQLYNVVEEMRIAAGLNVTPKIYIINSEMPNAFATGIKPENSAIAVTAGLLSRMNRDELQGVVAHEMSHINNRDIRFMTIAGVMMGTIIIISQFFLRGMFYSGGGRRSSSKGGGQAQIIILIIAVVFAILAPILARLLYFALSRKREYLADASAVRLTRYPEGLASALEKIANSDAVMPTANKVTAPMYICNPLKRKNNKVSDLSSTHPPISERIRILRNMSGGANYINYEQAYDSVRNKSGLIPKSAMMEVIDVPIRQGLVGEAVDVKTTTRATGDIMMAVDNFTFIDCICGLKIKVPPQYSEKYVYCTRCGRQHEIGKS